MSPTLTTRSRDGVDLKSGLHGALVNLEELIALRGEARHLEWLLHQRVRTARAGTRHSRFRGRGIDFAEVRVYEPGDDVRHIDWRVTARTGQPHTKLFQEERERPILVVADLGPSSFFGTRRRMKSVAISELTALLLWRAYDHGDRVGALIRDVDDHQAFRPRHARSTLLRILRHLELTCAALAQRLSAAAPPASDRGRPGFRLADALGQARRVARPGSRVLVLSDFADPDVVKEDGDVARNLLQLGRHCDLEVLHVTDPFERDLPPAALYPVSDGRERRLLDTSPATSRVAWRQRHQARSEQLARMVRRARGRYGSFGTEDDLVARLGSWLR